MQRIAPAFIVLVLMAACLPNPEGPVLEAPGAPPSEYVSEFPDIQINGDFSGVNWDPTDPRHYLSLEADYVWSIWVSVLESDYGSDTEIRFKFTTGASWEPENFGSSPDEEGLLVFQSGDPAHCVISTEGPPGFYKIWMNDQSLRYSHELDLATGGIAGGMSFEGPDPPAATVEIWAENEHGDAQLWTVQADGGDYEFANLADSLYTLIATANGYGSLTEQVRVSGGQVASFDFAFGEPLESANPDQPWNERTIDGIIDEGWEAFDGNNVDSPWWIVGWELDSLHTSWTGDTLYLGLSGEFNTAWTNAVLFYLDVDYGAQTGLNDLGLLNGEEDYTAPLSYMNKNIDFSSVPDFGIEFIACAYGDSPPTMAVVDPSTGYATPVEVVNMNRSTDAFELAIPWSLLYPELGGEGSVPVLSRLGVYAILAAANETAMEDPIPAGTIESPGSVVVIPIDQDGE